MEVELYVENLSKSTTPEELKDLFTQAGEVTATEVIKDRKSGESKGYAIIRMGAQSEADKAVSMFNAYSFSDQPLSVRLVKPRQQRGTADPIFAPRKIVRSRPAGPRLTGRG